MASDAHRKRIGAELRRIRLALGFSGEYVGGELGWSQSKLSRIESARFSYSVWDLAALLDFYEVPEEVRAELTSAIAEDSGVQGAWIVRAGGSPRRQGEVAAIETRVARIRQYHPIVVPGQLQSYEYARAIATTAGFERPDEIAEGRMSRQTLLVGNGPPRYDAVLDARALCRWPGSKAVLRDQLDHLVKRASLPAVSVHVIPLGGEAETLALSPFLIYDFSEGSAPTAVLLESRTADLYLSAKEDVATYTGQFDGLIGEALAPEESLTYLRSLVKDMTKARITTAGGLRA